jgi:hypothetical protein
MYVNLLQTIAQIAGTLAGFVGVVFILGHRAEGQLSERERSGVFHLLFTAICALILSLVLVAVLAATKENPMTWRAGAAVLGAFNFFGASRATIEKLRRKNLLLLAVSWGFPAGGFSVAVFAGLAAIGLLADLAPLACATNLIWFLVVSLGYFVNLLVPRKRRGNQ